MEMGIKKLRDPGLFKPKIWIFAKKGEAQKNSSRSGKTDKQPLAWLRN